MMWKDFFYFTKTERQGIIVLVVLILGACIVSSILSNYSIKKEVDPKNKEKFEKEYKEFVASLQDVKHPRKHSKFDQYTFTEREIILTPFDPNTADSITFLNLGLPPWMIKNILRYRSKSGKFHQAEDFKKIYGLTSEQYQKLSPYIRITESSEKKDTAGLLTDRLEKPDSIFKYRPGTVIDLNKADTTELKKIPGIGSGIARMIVNYRKRLGGFYQIEQLQDIHLKTERLRSWFSVDASMIFCINLNKVSLERMMYHPYINYYQAKAIIEYRKKKGKLNDLKQLSLYEEFTSEDFERIRPYVCFD